MDARFIMSSSPHIRHGDTTRRIMLDVIIALLPACAAGVYFFGVRVLLVIAVTVLACVTTEYLCRRFMKREQTIQDLSAVVTGILLALNLAPSIPLWIAAIGGVVAIFVVKQLFGGIGQNFINPALGARIILTISWPAAMTDWISPVPDLLSSATPDAVSSATPLGLLAEQGAAAQLPGYMDMFIGNIGGCIGETSALALLLGGLYLLFRRVITLEIPVAFIGTVALFTWIFGGQEPFTGDFVFHVLAGGLLLGAFYMATDYSTSPVTSRGKIIMGLGCGLLTSVIRLFGSYPEGVSFSIVVMNILVPLIDRYTVPVSFGGESNAA